MWRCVTAGWEGVAWVGTRRFGLDCWQHDRGVGVVVGVAVMGLWWEGWVGGVRTTCMRGFDWIRGGLAWNAGSMTGGLGWCVCVCVCVCGRWLWWWGGLQGRHTRLAQVLWSGQHLAAACLAVVEVPAQHVGTSTTARQAATRCCPDHSTCASRGCAGRHDCGGGELLLGARNTITRTCMCLMISRQADMLPQVRGALIWPAGSVTGVWWVE